MTVATDLPGSQPHTFQFGASLTRFDSQSPSVAMADLSFRHSGGRSQMESQPTHISIIIIIVVLLSSIYMPLSLPPRFARSFSNYFSLECRLLVRASTLALELGRRFYSKVLGKALILYTVAFKLFVVELFHPHKT